MTSTVDETSRDEAPGHGHRHLGIALAIICIAQLMVVLDATIVNIAIPYISDELEFTAANRSWIITGYTLAFGGLLLLGGRAGDLLGRRRVFIFGLVVFSVASFLGGIAWNSEVLLASRALQGLGAAVASPTALALITTTFPAGPPRNRAFAVYAAMSGAGAAVGLILGGWLTQYDWRWTFLINVPIGLVAAALAPRFLGESTPHRGSFDFGGAVTGTAGLVALVYGFTRAAETSWDDSWTIAGLVGGTVLLLVFLAMERVQRDPILPFHILADRTRGISFLVMLLVPAAMFAMFYFLSQIVQDGLGWSPLETGFAFLPFTFGIVISAGISSALATKVDPRWLAGVGATLAAVGLYGFSLLGFSDDPAALGVTASYWTDLFPWILVMSLGMGAVFVPLTITAVHGVGAADSGIGSGVLNAMQQVGGSLGLAILSTVAVSSLNDKATEIGTAAQTAQVPVDPEQVGVVAFTYGSTVAFVVGAAMIGVAALVTLLFLNVKHEELAADGTPEGVHVG